MENTRSIFTYISIAIIVLALGGLAGWYFFLSNKSNSTNATDTARGLGTATPSFEGTTGSNESNTLAANSWTGTGDGTANVSSNQLWEVEKTPVAGFGFVTVGTTSTSVLQHLYYTERSNGYIESADLTTRSSVRITNDLHPKVYEALFTTDGSVIQRAINDTGAISTFAGTVKTTVASGTTSVALDGFFFPQNIFELSVNPIAKTVFFLTHAGTPGNTGSVGITTQWDGSKQKQIFSSLVGSWHSQFLPDGRIILTESPSDNLAGYAYQLNSDGTLTDIERNIPGLTVSLDPSSKALIYGQSSQGTLSTYVQTAPNATTTPLSIATIADKCVWLPGKGETAYCAVPKSLATSTFLNDWYRGAVHTSDVWWQINAITGEVSQVYSPSSSDGVALDVQNPQMDSTGTYIAFTNANDESLWVLKITN